MNDLRRGIGILSLILVFLPGLVLAQSDVEYQAYNTFCLNNFGAENEALIYEAQGSTLEYVPAADWVHESENSAAVGFQTNLPAITRVEYGTTTSYGSLTEPTDRYYFNHLHYVRDLAPNTTYHYRLVATDERGNVERTSDRTFQTGDIAGAIHIPGDIAGPPYILNQSGATYVLTEDVVAQQRAFTLRATNIILDLNGHTVTYDEGTPALSGASWSAYLQSEESTFGIIGQYGVSGKILNGTVRQGQTNSQGTIGFGFNPLLVEPNGDRNFEVAGMTLEYGGHSVGGMILRGGDNYAHHNVVLDRGTGIDNRHQGLPAICSNRDGGDIRYNLVKRTRHQGIVIPGSCYANEVYVDSWATNSYGIMPLPNTVIEGNFVMGTGYHNVGIGWGVNEDSDFLTIRDNLVFLQGDVPTSRSDEYDSHASVNGMRLTQYGGETYNYRGYLYEDNYIIVKGQNGTQTMRGVQFFSDPHIEGLVFQNNVIKTELKDSATTNPAPCVVTQGLHSQTGNMLPVFYRNNRFISNSMMIRFGDSYGHGDNHYFRSCTLERFGSRSDYVTFEAGYWYTNSSGHHLTDTTVLGGADLEDLKVSGNPGGQRDYSVGYSVYITARDVDGGVIPDLAIEIEDDHGIAHRVVTDDEGLACLDILQFTMNAPPNTSTATKILRADHMVKTEGFQDITVGGDFYSNRDNYDSPVDLVFSPLDLDSMPGPPTGGTIEERP